MMFSITVYSILTIPILYFILNELRGLYKLLKYKLQGVKYVKYLPTPYTIYLDATSLSSNDCYETQKKGSKDFDRKEPFRMMNLSSNCILTLLSDEAIREYFKKELDVSIKQKNLKSVEFLGFFFQNGKEMMERRALFAKIFHYSNVVNMMPEIKNVIREHVRRLKKSVMSTGGTRKVDLKKEFSEGLFEDLTGCMLFKGASNKITDQFEGMSVTKILKKMFNSFYSAPTNPVNYIPYAEALGLNKEANEIRRLKKGLIEIIRKKYNKRYNKQELDDTSVLDIMIKLNKESEKETGKAKFTMEEICSNFEVFQFAASDTSFQLSCTTLVFLALQENKIYQKRVKDEINSKFLNEENYSNDALNSLKQLDLVFKEAARMANPAPQNAFRVVSKEFELCGYKIYKDDVIRVLLLGYSPQFFSEPFKFNPDRFDENHPNFKKIPKMSHIPFSHGQRGCLGKYLGEMMVKLLVVELIKEFEVSVDPGYKMKFKLNPLYGVDNPDLILSVRNSS